MTLTGFAVCAHTFVRINLYAQEHTRDSYGVLTANLIRMSWLRALFRRGVSAGAGVVVLAMFSDSVSEWSGHAGEFGEAGGTSVGSRQSKAWVFPGPGSIDTLKCGWTRNRSTSSLGPFTSLTLSIAGKNAFWGCVALLGLLDLMKWTTK